ncbi:uncharacterized protein [Dysidea avara]
MTSERDTSVNTAHHGKHRMDTNKNQSRLIEDSSQTQFSTSPISSKLTPVFDREENFKQSDISSSYNGASSSEESDYNQTSVIFSLDELQSSMTASSPDTGTGYHRTTTGDKQNSGMLFPGLVQDENTSESGRDEEEIKQEDEGEEKDHGADHFNLTITPPTVDITPLKSNDSFSDILVDVTGAVTQLKVDATNATDSNGSNIVIDTSPANTQPTIIRALELNSTPIGAQPSTSAALTDVKLDLSPSPFVSGELSPIVTPHIDTPVSNASPSIVGMMAVTNSSLISKVPHTGNVSVDSERVTDASISSVTTSLSEKLKPTQNAFESPGLLFAHPVKKPKQRETFEPAEAATEALLAEEKSPIVIPHKASHHHVKAKADQRGEVFIDQSQIATFKHRHKGGIPLFYPPERGACTAAIDEVLLDNSALRDIEKNAKKVAEALDYMMDNLKYSLHAMATCTKLSVSLHKEAVDDMHTTVDECIKTTYAFLAKFEELIQNMKPVEELAAQIKDVSESLKVLEKAVR